MAEGESKLEWDIISLITETADLTEALAAFDQFDVRYAALARGCSTC